MALHARAAEEAPGSPAEKELRTQADQRDAEADAIRETMHRKREAGAVTSQRNDGCSSDQRYSSGSLNNQNTLGGASATINDRTGLYVAIVALILASLCAGILVMLPSLIDAKVQAGSAAAYAKAEEARTHARVALDKVEDFRAKLAEKGINVNLDGH